MSGDTLFGPEQEEALGLLLLPPPVLPALKEPKLGAVGAKWTRYSGTHRPCDLCTRRIHELGVEKAPPPSPASHKRVGPIDTLLLCNVDAEEQRRKDAAAERDRAARIAANGEKPSARRGSGKKSREGMS